ncbi:MBL fold metallo-hydrolase [Paenibacillus thermoaerophilus]|uniref:MBL fold metallo-hydrolase n=1 Tax=Paenibacillus thermoaerophilus TaxID=1215385 RepID=A0ABW2V5R9_9BACL|nr:MBL fold metallo-hydrolase [Paenibacillus thermoaerophilus]TMV13914.1 MBL fold metallo-hydrolase [Paenibacillus thermoaerophilus]
MKIEAISPRVWKLRSWLIIPITVWAVVDEEGLTLVDAGIGPMAGGILRFIADTGLPLKQIVLTHGHSDHTGALNKLLDAFPVPVYAHRDEIPYMEGRLPYPRRKKAAAVVAAGAVRSLETDADGRLLPIGGLVPYHTPGHSPGHVAYFEPEAAVLLAGDLFTSKRGAVRRPMPAFTADMAEAVRSSEIVDRLRPARLEVCHSGPVFDPAGQMPAYREAELRRLGVRNAKVGIFDQK